MVTQSTAGQPILILHVVRLYYYEGMDQGFYPGGFKWPAANARAGEIYNFKKVDGYCYGYVEITDDTTIRIEKLGAGKADKFIDGVLVVWTAPDPEQKGSTVVGWYRNARVYRTPQKPTGAVAMSRMGMGAHVSNFIVKAPADDCTILPADNRPQTIPRGKGLPGQKPLFYPANVGNPKNQKIASALEADLRDFIEGGIAVALSKGPKKAMGGQHQTDPDKRKEVEDAAITYVRAHFKNLGYETEDVSAAKCGWDLTATKGDLLLCIEVKGRSADQAIADFTFQEYDCIRAQESGKFSNGIYRICIVTRALEKPTLYHYQCMPTRNRKIKRWTLLGGEGYLLLSQREAARGTHST